MNSSNANDSRRLAFWKAHWHWFLSPSCENDEVDFTGEEKRWWQRSSAAIVLLSASWFSDELCTNDTDWWAVRKVGWQALFTKVYISIVSRFLTAEDNGQNCVQEDLVSLLRRYLSWWNERSLEFDAVLPWAAPFSSLASLLHGQYLTRLNVELIERVRATIIDCFRSNASAAIEEKRWRRNEKKEKGTSIDKFVFIHKEEYRSYS